jgi:hypothetical protein
MRRRVRVGGLRAVVLRRRRGLRLLRRLSLLLLGRLLLLLGAVMAHSAPDRRARDGMMARHVTGNAADRSPLEAPFRSTNAGKRGQYHEAEKYRGTLANPRRSFDHRFIP